MSVNKNNTDIKIFIVDDEEYYLNLEKINLNKYGFKDIVIFNTAEECLEQIEIEEPDCVIIDYLLKDGMNGDEFLKIVNEEYPNIYVLVLSGQEDINIATQIIKDGAYEYVVKNKMTYFNLNDTLNKIKEIKNTEIITRKKRYLYLGLILLTWVIGGVIIISIL